MCVYLYIYAHIYTIRMSRHPPPSRIHLSYTDVSATNHPNLFTTQFAPERPTLSDRTHKARTQTQRYGIPRKAHLHNINGLEWVYSCQLRVNIVMYTYVFPSTREHTKPFNFQTIHIYSIIQFWQNVPEECDSESTHNSFLAHFHAFVL